MKIPNDLLRANAYLGQEIDSWLADLWPVASLAESQRAPELAACMKLPRELAAELLTGWEGDPMPPEEKR